MPTKEETIEAFKALVVQLEMEESELFAQQNLIAKRRAEAHKSLTELGYLSSDFRCANETLLGHSSYGGMSNGVSGFDYAFEKNGFSESWGHVYLFMVKSNRGHPSKSIRLNFYQLSNFIEVASKLLAKQYDKPKEEKP